MLQHMQRPSLKAMLLYFLFFIGLGLGVVIVLEYTKQAPATGPWQIPFEKLSTADIQGDLVTVRNVRNFRYNGSEKEEDLVPNYYDKTYDLTKVSKVWYISSPFAEMSAAAHTFLSFEFSNGDFLSISIEARKVKGQDYSITKGMLRTYPIMYIAADEKDTVFVRANIRKADVYMYPVRTTKGREMLIDMLREMNTLAKTPSWYNTVTDNCTSRIAMHINNVSDGRIPRHPWQGYVTGYADAFALEHNLLDTTLTLEEARKKYFVTKRSQEMGYVEDYSKRIRQFED